MLNFLNIAVTAFNIAFALVFFIIILINVLRGISKGIIPTAVRTVFVFISGLISVLIAIPIGRVVSRAAVDMVNDFIIGRFPEFEELVEENPVIDNLMIGVPSMVITPIIYVIIFIIMLLIMIIPAHFVKKLISDKYPNIPRLRWAGGLCGVLTGIMMFVFLFAPTVGIISAVGNMANVVESISDTDENEESFENVERLTDNFLVKFVSGSGGRAIYSSLTAFKVNDEKVDISKEISVMADVVSNLAPVVDGSDPSVWKDEEVKDVKIAAKNLSDSELLSEVFAAVLSTATEQWEKDESFLGVYIKTTGKDSVDRFIKELFLCFSQTTKETVSKDIITLMDAFDVMRKHNVLVVLDAPNGDPGIAQNPEKEGFVSALLEVVSANKRFKRVTAVVVNLGVHETTGITNVPKTDSRAYNNFVAEVADAINNANENSIPLDNLKDTVYQSFTDNGMKVEKEITDYITEYLALDFKCRTDVSADEISEFFEVAFEMPEQKTEVK